MSFKLSSAKTQYDSKAINWVALEIWSTFAGIKPEKKPESGLSVSSFVLNFLLATRNTKRIRKAIWKKEEK